VFWLLTRSSALQQGQQRRTTPLVFSLTAPYKQQLLIASQKYDLRKRTHNKQVPKHDLWPMTYMTDSCRGVFHCISYYGLSFVSYAMNESDGYDVIFVYSKWWWLPSSTIWISTWGLPPTSALCRKSTTATESRVSHLSDELNQSVDIYLSYSVLFSSLALSLSLMGWVLVWRNDCKIWRLFEYLLTVIS